MRYSDGMTNAQAASILNAAPIPSSEFVHIDRTDDEPIRKCALCGGKRLAFYHYYGVPVCFVCQYNLGSMASHDMLKVTHTALSYALRQVAA